jgi:hypothetical protein
MVNTRFVLDFSASNFWLLRLVPRGSWGRWIAGGVIFVVVFGLFAMSVSDLVESATDRMNTSVALFFAILLAYIVPVHHLIVQRSLIALDRLNGLLPDDSELAATCRQRVLFKSPLWQVLVLSAGLGAGLAHNALLLAGEDLLTALKTPVNLLTMVITLVIWLVMTATISSLVQIAAIFKHLASEVRIDPLNTGGLTPFGSVAVSSTLAMIGAQAAFPLLIAGSDSHWTSFVPGLVATGVPMIFLFLLPVLPVHRRIVTTKREMLARVNDDMAPYKTLQRPDYPGLEPLLVYRREILEASEWPFDTSVMGRLALYLIIPPLTWIGAALIEILVDTAI